MSTRKIKDGTGKPLGGPTKTKKATESTKTKANSRTLSKKKDEEEDKNKKQTVKVTSNVNKKPSRPAPVRKITTTAKPPTNRPVTPPSSRVSKTQYFPSKKMYSNALKSEGGRKVHQIKTTVPKVASKSNANDVSPDTSSISDRPRTATLRKGSIVNKNIVGPEVPKIKAPLVAKQESPPNEYEDDFDSYESDFDAYESSESNTDLPAGTSSTSSSTESEDTPDLHSAPKRVNSAGTDDEKKMDSGNYELPESRHRQMLDNIKESIEKENANLSKEQARSNLGSLSDEGFEEAKSLQFINFLGAQKKYQHRKSVELRRKRGEEILSMIKLDHYSFTLFDLAPVPYDVFIKHFGRSNSVQISVQTGEDDLDEGVQTEEVETSNKWTQFPPALIMFDENDNGFWYNYKCNYLGVGEDVATKSETMFSEIKLEKFLSSAGNLILNLQAEANLKMSAQIDKSNIPFSKGHIFYDTQNLDVLKNRPIKDVAFSVHNSNKILSVHGKKINSECNESLACIWSISNVDTPDTFLFSFGELNCCNFDNEGSTVIFGGTDEGTLVLWDIKESKTPHSEANSISRCNPSYSTEINYGHSSKVISIQSITRELVRKNVLSFQNSATEICSLDVEGTIILWSVIFKEKNKGRIVEKQGLAHWGSVILIVNTKISLRSLYSEIDDFMCTDFTVSHLNSSNLYVSTNYGIILHCLSSGGQTNIKKFLPGTTSQANCIEMCPFSPDYLISGFDNGDIGFYTRSIERPLRVLSNRDIVEGKTQIQKIQWSHTRPLTFYTKDVANTIHVWNLKVSDLFPVCSIPFKENVVSMKISPISENSYMLIATDNGLIYVHILNEEHGQQSKEDFEQDKRRFLKHFSKFV